MVEEYEEPYVAHLYRTYQKFCLVFVKSLKRTTDASGKASSPRIAPYLLPYLCPPPPKLAYKLPPCANNKRQMKTAAALALCLVATAATSDDEQAQARARLLLQRAVEEVRAGVEQGVQGRAPAATAGAGGARRLAGSAHAGVISRAVYPESDTTCATTPMRWDVEMPHVFTDGECESFTHDGQTLSTRSSCASATSFSSNFYQGSSCSGTPLETEEVTDDVCAPVYDASYSYSFSYGDLDGYAKWGCEAINPADVSATITFHLDSVTCDDAAPKNYQVWHGGCQTQSDPDDLIQVSLKYSCDATDGFRVKFYTNADCSGSPNAEVTAFQADTCNQGMKVTCGCAAGVGCSDGSLGSDAAAARGPLLATAVLGAAAAAL